MLAHPPVSKMLLGTRARQRGFGAAALAVYDTLFRLGAELDLCFARACSGLARDRAASLDQIRDRIPHYWPAWCVDWQPWINPATNWTDWCAAIRELRAEAERLQLYIRDAASKAIVICIESQHICAQVRAALRDRPVAPPLNPR
jgi:hypothetical protein